MTCQYCGYHALSDHTEVTNHGPYCPSRQPQDSIRMRLWRKGYNKGFSGALCPTKADPYFKFGHRRGTAALEAAENGQPAEA